MEQVFTLLITTFDLLFTLILILRLPNGAIPLHATHMAKLFKFTNCNI